MKDPHQVHSDPTSLPTPPWPSVSLEEGSWERELYHWTPGGLTHQGVLGPPQLSQDDFEVFYLSWAISPALLKLVCMLSPKLEGPGAPLEGAIFLDLQSSDFWRWPPQV
jgi:hypothetical protein